jgi:c-di-AMP phosphodiesterase-like protein
MPILSYINFQNLTIVLNFLYLKKIDFVKLILFVIFFSFFFYLNLSNQSTNYGTRGGQFEDQADSYSHYLIRNTIINNIIGRENQNKSLIITKNYAKEDFNYYPDETKIYTHSRSYQNKIYQKIILNSPFFKINSDQNYSEQFS